MTWRKLCFPLGLIIFSFSVFLFSLAQASDPPGSKLHTKIEHHAFSPENIVPVVAGSSSSDNSSESSEESSKSSESAQECDYYRVDTIKIPGEGLHSELYQVSTDTSCLYKKITSILDACIRELGRAHQNLDDCLVCRMAGMEYAEKNKALQHPGTAKQYGGDGANRCEDSSGGKSAHGIGKLWSIQRKDSILPPFDTLYYDTDCNLISSEGRRLCEEAKLFWVWTPISLLWDGHSFERNPTVVNFPLNPLEIDKWYTWFGSSKTPLLVYDPEHSGKVKSGRQLFGQWTFGGKQTASLSNDSTTLLPQPWDNGYEALKNLDINNDGKISGKELIPLVLWFDNNRDGKVDSGEIKPLNEVEITELYYQPDYRDKQTGDVYANLGYKRLVDGIETIGASVDWFARGADSRAQLITQLASSKTLCKKNLAQDHLFNLIDNVSFPPDAESTDRHTAFLGDEISPISGLWSWRSNDPRIGREKEALLGYLFLQGDKEGSLKGFTFSELPFKAPHKGAAGVIAVQMLAGKKIALEKSTAMEFSFRGNLLDKSYLENHIVLSDDGNTLNGETTAHMIFDGKKSSFSYSWVATKVM